MGLRPGKCYRSLKDRAWTRLATKVPRRNYIGTSPGMKTRQFNMGNGNREYTHIVEWQTEEAVQVRDNAIESARMAINRHLTKALGKEGFFMKVRIYPHNILRENKQAQGAHADRIQTGMSHPFGKPIGRSARVRKGQKIVSILCDEKDVKKAKSALESSNSRMTCRMSVKIGTDVKSIGTKPKKTRDMLAEEEAAAEKTEEAKAETTAKPEAGKKEETKGKDKPAATGKAEEKPKAADKKEAKK